MIEPNGKWSRTSGNDPSLPQMSYGRASSAGSEDLVEIQDMPRITSVKSEVNHEPNFIRTPPVSSREHSSSSAPSTISNNKRAASQVVDLTLSSEDDEEPPRAAKRQITHKSSSVLPRISGMENVPIRSNGINGISGASRQQTSNPFGITPPFQARDPL